MSGAPLKSLTLPSVRLGILTKLNLFAIGLIVVAVAATSWFYFWLRWDAEASELRQHGTTVVSLLTKLAGSGVDLANAKQMESLLDDLKSETDIAYLSVHDGERRVLLERPFAAAAGGSAVPALAPGRPLPPPGTTTIADRTVDGQHYVELVAALEPASMQAMTTPRAQPLSVSIAAVDAPSSGARYLRLGMSFGRTEEQFQQQVLRALAVIGMLLFASVIGTLAITRRLVAPIQRLTAAARAVGSGQLDMHVPVTSSDELGLFTHAFNHMTDQLAITKAELVDYQHTLEEKVTQRTEELQIATAHAYKIAQHDILTGLPNRSLLNQRLWQILAQAEREGNHVACLFLDFDHFKRINDTLGHDAGDQLLQDIAQRLTGAVREDDTVARLGGDEFVVVLPDLDPARAAAEISAVLTRIRESFMAPFHVADQVPTLTCSIGVSTYPEGAQDVVSLIKQADTAMYAAKDAGRNAYRFYSAEMNKRVQQRLQLETDMRRGLMANEFFIVYQPKIDMRSGKACAVEALLRWRDPLRGVIDPAEFIPVAEESGMILALGAHVLREACRQVAQWRKQGIGLRVSVNLSVHQLQHESWIAMLTDALQTSGLKSPCLDLEITESVIITHPEKAVATLMELKKIGVSVTIDDFGTGYSSLSYLTRLPIQGVKIDQRFVSGIGHNPNDAMVTQAIIALSHSLGLRVVAEGVTSVAQFDFLKTHGCDEAQGYLMSGPLDAEALPAWWQAQADTK